VISKALRGSDIGGLVRYLFGPGRANEHTNQRVVACSDPTWTGTVHPDKATIGQLIAELQDPVVRHGDSTRDGYVYHVAVSLPAQDGQLTDAQWQQAAQRFADKLGFDDQVHWVAINHGLTVNSNDHIHFVVNLIRDDTGRAQKLPYDRMRRREACIELEEQFGLTATAPAGQGQTSSLSRREIEAVRAGQVASVADLSQHRVATIVRAVAAGARSEGEFVDRLRGEGLVVRARYARDDRSTVTGYSVAAKTGGCRHCERSGGRLTSSARPRPPRGSPTRRPAARPSLATSPARPTHCDRPPSGCRRCRPRTGSPGTSRPASPPAWSPRPPTPPPTIGSAAS
jgi:hypothetical protein